jgi:hypothetical protein
MGVGCGWRHAVALGDIHSIAQQFEAAVLQQSKTVQVVRQPLQCSFCQLPGHSVQTCYKKRNANSNRQNTTNSKTITHTNSHNTIILNLIIFPCTNYTNHTTINYTPYYYYRYSHYYY